jgi:PAS domain S-box-containing protein
MLESVVGANQRDDWPQRINRYKTLSWTKQKELLPGHYLELEELISLHGSQNSKDKREFRHRVSRDYYELLSFPGFGVIFESHDRQEILLCKFMLLNILDACEHANLSTRSIPFKEISKWLDYLPYSCQQPTPFNVPVKDENGDVEMAWIVKSISKQLYISISDTFGEDKAKSVYDKAFENIAGIYRTLDAFTGVVGMLPEVMIVEERLSMLTRSQVNEVLNEKISSLNHVSAELSKEMAQRVKVTKELRENRVILKALINSAMDAVFAMDEKGEIVLWNKKSAELFGWSEEEILGEVANRKILPEDERGQHINWFRKYLETGQSGFINRYFELTCLCRDGSTFPGECSISPIELEHGKLSSVFIRDIEKRKQYEETLRSAKEEAESAAMAKSEFLAIMSHEIRTPLNGVIGMTDLLSDTTLSSEQRNYLSLIKASGNNLLVIINDILDFSKIEAGKMELESVPFDLNSCLLQSLKVFSVAAAEKNVRLFMYSDPDIPAEMIGDSARIGQIALNLVSNSIKFTDEGEIVLRSKLLEIDDNRAEVMISVTDSGIGIDQQNLDNIFSAFSQEDSSTSRKYGGTGLGLAICSRLSQMMGGRIWAESAPDKGSSFVFTASLNLSGQRDVPSSNREFRPLNGLIGVALVGNETLAQEFKTSLQRVNVTLFTSPYLDEVNEILEKHPDASFLIADSEQLASEISLSSQTLNKGIKLLMTHQMGIKMNIRSSIKQMEGEMLPIPFDHRGLYKSIMSLFNEAPLESPGTLGTTASSSLKILVAEDNLINQTLIKTLLQKLGFKPDIANNGVEAVEFAEKTAYDLVFMDIQMPEKDGYEATRDILALSRERGSAPDIIALTANASSEDRKRCLNSGMKDFLSKPYRFEQLISIIEGVSAARERAIRG